ncbi:MAG: zinc metallopeptidase [Gammaproteobacteria bacterium]|nr:zinc metallopeptidase [Gammaproteobacteria bacterium]
MLLVVSLITGQDFLALLDQGPESPLPGGTSTPRQTSPEEEKLVDFVSFVLDDVQGTWHTGFPQSDKRYQDAKLVLFTDAVRSNCGFAESAMGPFYCPLDQKVYIDLGFYRDLKQRFGAPGDFAQAYVTAHEIGHHVQHLLGIDAEVRRVQNSRPGRAAALSVRLELQADCLAGVWGSATRQRGILEQGDVEEALGAAAAIGDDRIQRQSGGSVNPETWTHGSSKQRVAWFRRGFQSGRMQACETFSERLAEDG